MSDCEFPVYQHVTCSNFCLCPLYLYFLGDILFDLLSEICFYQYWRLFLASEFLRVKCLPELVYPADFCYRYYIAGVPEGVYMYWVHYHVVVWYCFVFLLCFLIVYPLIVWSGADLGYHSIQFSVDNVCDLSPLFT